MNVRGLALDDLTVVPSNLPGRCFIPPFDLAPEVAGISPDLFLRLRQNGFRNKTTHILIECKTIGAGLNHNQKEAYPRLLKKLQEKGISGEYLVAISVGVGNTLYSDVRELQYRMVDQHLDFGLLLWEDILQKMKSSGFQLPGIDVDSWQAYTGDLEKDAAPCDRDRP